MILVLWDDRNAIAIPRTTGLFSRLFTTPRARFSGNKKISSPFLFFAISRCYFPKFAQVDLVPDQRGRSSSDIAAAEAE